MNQFEDIANPHRQTWDLIPWVINQRASSAERLAVEEHLQHCPDCRDEFAFQQRLFSEMADRPVHQHDPRAALRRLWKRIDGGDDQVVQGPSRPVQGRRYTRRDAWMRGLVAAVVFEAIGLSAMGIALWNRAQPPALYQTLTAPSESARAATVRVVLAPTLTLGQMAVLLEQSRMQIVSGPSEAGVYSLAPLSANTKFRTGSSLALLRANPGVRFAEPIDSPAKQAQ